MFKCFAAGFPNGYAFCLAVSFFSASACGGDFAIARRGRPADCSVVISKDASPSVSFAANEFRDYVKRMTGVELAVTTDDRPLHGKAVLIGRTCRSGELPPAAGDAGELGDEGFRIAVKGRHLHILGSDARGALYGVYEVLERFGGAGRTIERNVDEVGDGYAWYGFEPSVLDDKMVFEFGSGPWEHGGGIGATKEVRLDRLEIFRIDAPGTSFP